MGFFRKSAGVRPNGQTTNAAPGQPLMADFQSYTIAPRLQEDLSNFVLQHPGLELTAWMDLTRGPIDTVFGEIKPTNDQGVFIGATTTPYGIAPLAGQLYLQSLIEASYPNAGAQENGGDIAYE
jgi:hypothetical protein